MSDDSKKMPDAAAPQPDGFQAAASAQPVSPEEAARAQEPGAAVMAASPDTAADAGERSEESGPKTPRRRATDRLPPPIAPQEIAQQARSATQAALEAVASSATNKQLETLTGLVLDAADVANRAAAASTAAGTRLQETNSRLDVSLAQANKHSKIVLAVAGGISVLSLLLCATMVVMIGSRIARLDATVVAVGKRVVDMNAGLEDLGAVKDTLAELQAKTEGLTAIQGKLEGRLEQATKVSQNLAEQVPQQTAKEVEARTLALVKQVQAMEGRMGAQANAVKAVSEQMKGLQGSAEGVGALKRDVEALVTLQRERYLEVAKAATAANSSAASNTSNNAGKPPAPVAPKGIQYPRPQPPGEMMNASPNANPSAGSTPR